MPCYFGSFIVAVYNPGVIFTQRQMNVIQPQNLARCDHRERKAKAVQLVAFNKWDVNNKTTI